MKDSAKMKLLLFFYTCLTVLACAQGNFEVRLYKASHNTASRVLKTMNSGKVSADDFTKGLDSWTRTRQLDLLLRSEEPIKDENKVTEAKSTGEFVDPVSGMTRNLGANLEYTTLQEDPTSEVAFHFKVNYTDKRNGQSIAVKSLEVGRTIDTKGWHLLGLWREEFDYVFLLGRGQSIPKPLYADPELATAQCKLALFEVERADFLKFQKAARSSMNVDASALAKRGKFLQSINLSSNSDKPISCTDEYRVTAKVAGKAKTLSYGLTTYGTMQLLENGKVAYKLKTTWKKPPAKGELTSLTFNFEEEIFAGRSRVIAPLEKATGGTKQKVLILLDSTKVKESE